MRTNLRPEFNEQQYNVLVCPPKVTAGENHRKKGVLSIAVLARDCRSGVIFL